MSKTCKTCKKIKDDDQFSTASSGKKGMNFRARTFTLKNQCKSCDAAYARAFREKNKNYRGSGKIKYNENKYLASAIGTRLIEAKARAKKSSIPFNIDKEYLQKLYQYQQGKCAISKITLIIEPKQLESLSLDKINPLLGYTKGNVQWVTWAVNRAKGDMEQSEFISMCRVITEKCNDYPKREYTSSEVEAHNP